jgi:DNA ligase D-like protein (predicted ligase)/DNA ligase D-like protein (predicted polymerase)/DNA ligase D-like protein (predicted 3'-phosphoesterase)
MAKRTAQLVQVGKRKIELSNLGKIIFPEDHLVKAQVVEYYLTIAPTILSHIKGRALSLLRFPDGIHGEQFFQKNKPQWTPDWLESVELGDDDKGIDYLIASEEATLVWLANLACLELHQMHARKPHFDKPDYFVFDLDPPEGDQFARVVDLALRLRPHLEQYGYHPFVKTTGGKGLHVVIPIEPKWDFTTAFEAASSIAKPFVEANSSQATLHIKKEARKGKILVDIYRNRDGQSIVSAYSLRGRPGAPVSMPVPWEKLTEIRDPHTFTMTNVPQIVLSDGDAWEAIGAYAVHLHTQRVVVAAPTTLPVSRKRKTPQQLETYARKRSFSATPEPHPEIGSADGHGFVIHRHHASRLHYDLRLEQDGTLKSWAVPRGMPPRPGIKRLAVQTEDHPMKYLTWEGEIPKGQYGGGMMWVYALGRYEIIKQKKDGFYFRLQSRELNAEYRIYRTRGTEWLLERLDNPQIDWTQDAVTPMLAQSAKAPPQSDNYIYEIKWDGIRALLALQEGELRIQSRNQRNISAQFPELLIPEQALRATATLLDAEIVCLDDAGKPDFKAVIHRLQQRSDGGIKRAAQKYPAVCYVFDCLYLDGRSLINDPLMRRREWLTDLIKKETPYRVSDYVTDGIALFAAAQEMGLEGIVAKEKDGRYQPGKRSSSWIKIKTRHTAECLILGYTKGKGDRSKLFGALQLGETEGDDIVYRGKVGSGFDAKSLKSVLDELKKCKTVSRFIREKPIDDARTIWIEPRMFCEIEYAALTQNGTYREPVFLRLRPDLTAD